MAKQTKLRLKRDAQRTRAVVKRGAVRRSLPELGRLWAEAKAEELKAKEARVRVQNRILEALGLSFAPDTLFGVVEGSVDLTGLEVYREPRRINHDVFPTLCKLLGISIDKVAPRGKRQIDLDVWNSLPEAHRVALAVGLDSRGQGFLVRVPDQLYQTAKNLDKAQDDEL